MKNCNSYTKNKQKGFKHNTKENQLQGKRAREDTGTEKTWWITVYLEYYPKDLGCDGERREFR